MTTPLAWPSPLLIHPGLFISHALCPRQTAAGSSQVFLPFVLSSPIHPPYSARLTVRKHKTDCYSPTSNPSVVPAVLGTKPKLLGRHTRLLLNWPPPACSDSSWDTPLILAAPITGSAPLQLLSQGSMHVLLHFHGTSFFSLLRNSPFRTWLSRHLPRKGQLPWPTQSGSDVPLGP